MPAPTQRLRVCQTVVLACILASMACASSKPMTTPDTPPPVDAASTLPPGPAEAPEATPSATTDDCQGVGGAFHVYCVGATAAGQWTPVDMMQVPEDAEVLFLGTAPGSGGTSGRRLTIAARGEQLFVAWVQCGACRRILGNGFVGRLDLLEAAQVLHVQQTLGLPADIPALRTAEAWASFAQTREATLQALVESDLAR